MSPVTRQYLRRIIREWLDEGSINHEFAARLLRLVGSIPEVLEQIERENDVHICPRTSANGLPSTK